jgi:hypothetical protein
MEEDCWGGQGLSWAVEPRRRRTNQVKKQFVQVLLYRKLLQNDRNHLRMVSSWTNVYWRQDFTPKNSNFL